MLSEGRFGAWNKPFPLDDEIGLIGGWDLLTGESRESKILLVDFKASVSDARLDRRQLYLYVLGVVRMFGFDIPMVSFLLFKQRKTYYYPITEQILKETYEWVKESDLSIKREEFQQTPSKKACRLCDFRNSCKYSYYNIVHEEEKKGGGVAELPLAEL